MQQPMQIVSALLFFGSVLVLTMASVAVPVVANLSGKADTRDLYLLLHRPMNALSKTKTLPPEALPVGVKKPLFATLVTLRPNAHEHLVQSGYVLLPAGALAFLCTTFFSSNRIE